MAKRRFWVKVQMNWYTTPSHEFLSPIALHTGPKLLCLADLDPDWRASGRGRLLNPVTKRPMTVDEIALAARWDVESMVDILDQLLACGTLERDEEAGCYTFPNYRKWQEDRTTTWRRDKTHVAEPVATQRAEPHQRDRGTEGQNLRGGEGDAHTPTHDEMKTPGHRAIEDQAEIARAWNRIDGRDPTPKQLEAADECATDRGTLQEVLAVIGAIAAMPRDRRPRNLASLFWSRHWPRTIARYLPPERERHRTGAPAQPEQRPEPIDRSASPENAALGEKFLEQLSGRLADDKRTDTEGET